MKSYCLSWSIFIRERFPLIKSIVPLFFLLTSSVFVIKSTEALIIWNNVYITFSVLILFFFRLRIFDELKDFSTDCKVNPSRPLPRGLIKYNHARNLAFLILLSELFLSACISIQSLSSAILFGAYSILMYKEFFLSNWLRSKLATYAITHTIVASFIPLFIFSSLTNEFFWKAPITLYLFSVSIWMLFNIYEFGRKTFSQNEERELRESYSKNFGSHGAALCIALMASIATLIIFYLSIFLQWSIYLINFEILLVILLLASSLLYAYLNTTLSAKIFRTCCSIYILVFNMILSIGLIL